MKRIFGVLMPLLAGLALSELAIAAPAPLKIRINGQPTALSTATVGGQLYLPLEALKKLGVPYTVQGGTLSLDSIPGAGSSAGGANERPSLEGCLNEPLFNGVWRLKVMKLERIRKDEQTPGWGLTLELRNGSRTTLGPTDAGIDGTGVGIQLAFADATTLNVDPYDVQQLTFATLPQGGVMTKQLKFYFPYGTPPNAGQTPTKLLFEVDPQGIGNSAQQAGVAFSTPRPSFRVRLDCQR